MAKPPTPPGAYLLFGWRTGVEYNPEMRAPFATLAAAQAEAANMTANNNIVILGPIAVAQIVAGQLTQ